jgi:hypothetical protein
VTRAARQSAWVINFSVLQEDREQAFIIFAARQATALVCVYPERTAVVQKQKVECNI